MSEQKQNEQRDDVADEVLDRQPGHVMQRAHYERMAQEAAAEQK